MFKFENTVKSLELNRALRVIPKDISHAGYSGSFETYFEVYVDQLDTNCSRKK